MANDNRQSAEDSPHDESGINIFIDEVMQSLKALAACPLSPFDKIVVSDAIMIMGKISYRTPQKPNPTAAQLAQQVASS